MTDDTPANDDAEAEPGAWSLTIEREDEIVRFTLETADGALGFNASLAEARRIQGEIERVVGSSFHRSRKV